jgi:hypothetical protein
MRIIPYQPPPGTWKGIDTAGSDHSPGNVITRELARALVAAGYFFVFRYINLDGTVLAEPDRHGGDYWGCWSLSKAELRWCLEEHLAVGLVQWGTFGDAAAGMMNGEGASECARKLGIPPGVHIFADVEGRRPHLAGAWACKRYIEPHARSVVRAGDRGGLYYCGQVPLTSRQLWGLRKVTSYWAAAGPVPAPPKNRGCSLEQSPPTEVCGIGCDIDTLRQDRFGETPYLVATPEIDRRWWAAAAGQLWRPVA